MAIYIVKSWYKKGWKNKVWVPKTWNGLSSFYGYNVWTDGQTIYLGSDYILDSSTSTWSPNSASNPPGGLDVWYCGDDVYYSYNSTQIVLNKTTGSWSSKSWANYIPYGRHVWYHNASGLCFYTSRTPGTSYANGISRYLLPDLQRWNDIEWMEPDGGALYTRYLNASHVWTDGVNTYYSNSSETDTSGYPFTEHNRQYILNVNLSETYKFKCNKKTWGGTNYLYGYNVWHDDGNTYNGITTSYKLNTSTDTWESIVWDGVDGWSPSTSSLVDRIWHDGRKTYYSYDTVQYELV